MNTRQNLAGCPAPGLTGPASHLRHVQTQHSNASGLTKPTVPGRAGAPVLLGWEVTSQGASSLQEERGMQREKPRSPPQVAGET